MAHYLKPFLGQVSRTGHLNRHFETPAMGRCLDIELRGMVLQLEHSFIVPLSQLQTPEFKTEEALCQQVAVSL